MSDTTTKVEVESYYDAVHRESWGRRVAGFMSGTTIGAVSGGIIGAVAAFLPVVLGAVGIAGAAAAALPTLAAVAVSAATFAAVGGSMGFAAVGMVGAQAGAVAAGLEEKEKREKLEKIGSASQAAGNVQAVTKEGPPRPSGKWFNWKVAVATTMLFAAFGAIMAIAPIAASAVALLGFQAGTVAGVAASAAVTGMMGTTIGINFPRLTNEVGNKYLKLIRGQYFDRKPAEETTPQPSREAEKMMDGPAPTETLQPTRSFAEKEKRFALEGILDKNNQDHNTVLTR